MDVERVDEDNECPICRNGMEGHAQARMASCQHNFHADCIRKVLIGTSSCPMCRTSNRKILVEGPAEPLHEETFFDIVPMMREKCYRCLSQDAGEKFQCFGCAFQFHTACEGSRFVLNDRVSYCGSCKEDRVAIKDAVLDRLDEERNIVLNAVRELGIEERNAFYQKVYNILGAYIQLSIEFDLFGGEHESDESDGSD